MLMMNCLTLVRKIHLAIVVRENKITIAYNILLDEEDEDAEEEEV